MTRNNQRRPAGGKDGFTSKGAARGNRSRPQPGAGAGVPRPAANKKPISPNRQGGFSDGKRPYDYSYYESEPATPEYLARLFARHDFKVGPEELGRFWKYYDLLRRHNASLDLTRIMGIEATVLKHFIDSAIVLEHIDLPGPVLDIGSGPGFPGVPLAIMQPKTHFILGESRGKRVTFLEEVKKSLKLSNVEIFAKSIREDSPLGRDCGKPIASVITRALETIAPTLERVLPFIDQGGRAVFMKGPQCGQEVEDAEIAYKSAYRLVLDKSYVLPKTDQQRRLVAFERL